MSITGFNDLDLELLKKYTQLVSDNARENNITIAQSLIQKLPYIKENRRKIGVADNKLANLKRYTNFILLNASEYQNTEKPYITKTANKGLVSTLSYELDTLYIYEFSYAKFNAVIPSNLIPSQVQFYFEFLDLDNNVIFTRGSMLKPPKKTWYYHDIWQVLDETLPQTKYNVQILRADLIVICRNKTKR